MKKVKVTQEQADAIEFGNEKHPNADIVRAHTNFKSWSLVGELKSLNKLSLDELIKALYIGYEVEPEFKVGDWVFYELDNRIAEIYQVPEEGKAHIQLSNGDTVSMIPVSCIHHANKSEIAAEKERRMDEKLDKLLLDLSDKERVRLHQKLEYGESVW